MTPRSAPTANCRVRYIVPSPVQPGAAAQLCPAGRPHRVENPRNHSEPCRRTQSAKRRFRPRQERPCRRATSDARRAGTAASRPGPRAPLGDTVAAAPPASFQVRSGSLGGTTPLACSCWYPPGDGRHRHQPMLRIRRPGTLPGELRRRRACRLYRPAAARRTVLHLTSRMPDADGAVPVTGRKRERPSSDRAPCRSRRATIPTHRTPMNRGGRLVGWRTWWPGSQ